MRVHHCYADGIAMVQVMLSMTETTARGSLALPPEEVEPAGSAEADFWEQILKPVTGALEGASRVGRSLLDQGKELAANPVLAQEALEGVTRKGMDFAGEIARLALMGSDSPTRFKGRLGVRKRVAWAEPLPLDEVKVMGKALDCSINDVLLSMATGALRDYLASKGDAVDGIEIRAIVPVNLRPVGRGRELGNQFGLVFLELPIAIDHPLERLYEVRRRMQALKGSYQPLIVLGLLHTVGYGPKVLQEQITGLLSQNASAVMTNVPGPQHPLYFAGRRITELNFWVPQSGGIGMGVSLLSYNGRIQFGVITDAGLVPDPDRIVGRFHDEFEKLMWLTLMSSWGEEAPDDPPATAAPESTKTPARRRKPAAGKSPGRAKIRQATPQPLIPAASRSPPRSARAPRLPLLPPGDSALRSDPNKRPVNKTLRGWHQSCGSGATTLRNPGRTNRDRLRHLRCGRSARAALDARAAARVPVRGERGPPGPRRQLHRHLVERRGIGMGPHDRPSRGQGVRRLVPLRRGRQAAVGRHVGRRGVERRPHLLRRHLPHDGALVPRAPPSPRTG